MAFENLAQCCAQQCSRHAGNVLFSFNGADMTYAGAWTRICVQAHFLEREGFRQGDVIGLLAVNSPEWCLWFMAITSIGCIAVPLDTGLPSERYDAMLNYVGAKAVFLSESFLDLPTSVRKISLTSVSDDVSAIVPPRLSRTSPAAYLFTSGTTGDPKVVTLTHGNILHIATVCTSLEEYTEKDVTLAILPLFHVYALESTFLAPFVTGSRIVLQPSLKGPDIIRSLAENPVTIFPAAPQMWRLFFDGIAGKLKARSMFKYRFFMFLLDNAPLLRALGFGPLLRKVFSPIHDVLGRSHRFFISGGAPLKKEYFNYYKNMGFRIMEGYGLTETTGPIAIPYYKTAVAGTVGAPIPGNEVIIKNAGADGIGEVWLRGEAVMAGYFRNDEANRAALDAEGFFNSGDLGRLDRKGAIWLTGRFKNVIVLDSGKNVYPEEIEQYYSSCASIEEISVFGHAIDGEETVCAVIVPAVKNGSSWDSVRREIRDIEKGLPSYKTVRSFALSFDPLPKNSTRKVLPSKVRELWESGALIRGGDQPVPRRTISASNAREQIALELMKRLLKRGELHVDDTFAGIGVDSLKLVDIVVRCEEETGLSIDLSRVTSVNDLFVILSTQNPGEGDRIGDRLFGGPVTTKMPPFFNPFHHLSLWLLRFLSVLFWRVSVVNRAALGTPNCIIAANHQSNLDVVWIGSAIPVRRRKDIYSIGKKNLSFLRYLVPMLPVIFVDRAGNTFPALKAAADILRSGKTLVIFPEGTRTRTGEAGEFRSGAAYLSKNLGRPIVPVTIIGAYDIYPCSRLFPRIFTRTKGKLVVGDPVDPSAFPTAEALNEEIRRIILGKESV